MASRVEVGDSPSSFSPPPYCIHGPTLIFRRYYQDKQTNRQFYACAVHRNRKGCQFFHYTDQSLSEEKREHYMSLYREHQASLTRSHTVSLSDAPPPISSIRACIECGVLYVGDDETHNGHLCKEEVTEEELQHPTMLMYPVSDNKSQAQYFFSDKTQSFLLSEIKRLNFSHVICLGTPRFFEALSGAGMKRFLLDIDHRYTQFYGEDVFQRFNMFNGFFYNKEEGKQSLMRFIDSVPQDKILLIIDPPFGGLLNALKTGVGIIWKIIGKECSTLLVFPYFNEVHVVESFPNFIMLDYQVTYDNHRYYGDKGKRGKPSPVRVFTNIPLPGLILPSEEGYRYCSVCNRYVGLFNKHCSVCDCCTSKDGRSYKHCYQCGICVKESHVHCEVCNSCQPSQHDCQQKTTRKAGCFRCGALDHKKLHCPFRLPKTGRRQKRLLSFVAKRKQVLRKRLRSKAKSSSTLSISVEQKTQLK